jgi:hypothetical protein
MKRMFSLLVVIFAVFNLNAQVTLEKKYDFSTSVVKLETLGYKYYLMDVPNSQCRLYNTDHSLFKIIPCSVPVDCYLSDIRYISEKLFDTDAGLELVYSWYKYVPTTSSYYYLYGSKVANEDGSEIVKIDGAQYCYINQTGSNTFKMLAYCYDYSAYPEKIWTNIYNLPGTVVSAQYLNQKTPEFLLNAFPNPASKTVTVKYELPDDVSTAKLLLVDNSGRPVNKFTIDNHIDHLELDITHLSSGVYYYFVEYGTHRTSSEKLVIQ